MYNITQIDRIKKTIEQIESVGLNKNTILSLEDFVGNPLVSSKTNINKLTQDNSSVCIVPVLDILREEVINNPLPTTTKITTGALLSLFKKNEYAVNDLIDRLATIAKIDNEVLNRFIAPNLVCTYINEDNVETDELVDISKAFPLMKALTRYDYIEVVIRDLENGTAKYNMFVDRMHSYDDTFSTNSSAAVPILLSSLSSGLHVYNKIVCTYTDMSVVSLIELFKRLPEVIDSLRGLANVLASEQNEIMWSALTPDSLTATYRMQQELESVLNDPISGRILSAFRSLK